MKHLSSKQEKYPSEDSREIGILNETKNILGNSETEGSQRGQYIIFQGGQNQV